MEVVPHTDAGAFARLARPLLEPDPVRHTTLLTALAGVVAGAVEPVVAVTVHDRGVVVGALLRPAERAALVSAVPAACVSAVVDALLRLGVDPGGAMGPAEEAEAFATMWTARTCARTEVAMRMRLFALEGLRPPTGVPGSGRVVAPGDEAAIDVLAAWRDAFHAELGHTWSHTHRSRQDVVDALATSTGELLWEAEGVPLAQASARAVTAGMSRIGPVYTPPEHRGQGYAAAVTAAAARWALGRGARHVLLYTDLANPTTNRLYPRLGFRPRYDALELRFLAGDAPPRPKG
jgi:GNAT superfamily N-acetyltransferase